MYIGLRVKYPLFLSDFNETLLSRQTSEKNTQVLNFMKILSVGAELFHADGQTDRSTERKDRHYQAHSRFSQIWERAKKKKHPAIKPETYFYFDIRTLHTHRPTSKTSH